MPHDLLNEFNIVGAFAEPGTEGVPQVVNTEMREKIRLTVFQFSLIHFLHVVSDTDSLNHQLMQKSVQARKNRIISRMNGQFQSGLPIFKTNRNTNRNLHISGLLNEGKVDIGDTKVDIENEKVDIQDIKVDIESALSEKGSDFSVKTTIHIHRLFEKFGFDEVFGRSAVMELLGLKSSGASKLLSNLVQADIIEPVSGHGKGKYKFRKQLENSKEVPCMGN